MGNVFQSNIVNDAVRCELCTSRKACENTKIDKLYFEGLNYPVWDIEYGDELLTFSCCGLEQQLMIDGCEYVSDDTRYVDEQFFYYLDENEIAKVMDGRVRQIIEGVLL